MKPNHRNILLRVVLALAFLISNVGLPIVLVACPVTEKYSIDPSCCRNQTEQHGMNLSSSTYNCCEKTVVAPPLRFESIELKSTVSTVQKLKVEYSVSGESVIFASAGSIASRDPSPDPVLLFARDSCLLTSSLRI
jgi:hypothetical protein